MLVWLTIRIYEFIFAAEISGEALGLLCMFGFFELFIEVAILLMFICVVSYAAIENKLEKK